MSAPHPRPEGCHECRKTCSVFYTGIIDGKAGKVAMCPDCPTAKAMLDPGQFGLLSAITGNFPSGEKALGYERCPVCGSTPIDFKKHNRFGCPHCYEHMDVFVRALLRAVQPDLTHHGKRPVEHGEAATRNRLASTRARLAEAVKNERFEEAVTLRDEIRAMEASLTEKNRRADPPPGHPV